MFSGYSYSYYTMQRFYLTFHKKSNWYVFMVPCFYIAQYPVCCTTQSTLHFTPWQTCSFQHQPDFSGNRSSRAAIMREDYSVTFPPLSIARYSFIQPSELGYRGENKNAQTLKKEAKGIRTRPLCDCESRILPLSYRAHKHLYT